MNLPKLAIENHYFSNAIIFLFVLLGIVAFLTMPRSEDPPMSPAGSSVIVIYPGANPADMEELIIDPIEEVINELEDIKDLSSTARDGVAILGVEFHSGSDPAEKYSDVLQKVNSIRHQLPADIMSLEIRKWAISDVNILQLAFMSVSAPYSLMESEAKRLKKLLERVPGVMRVDLWAYPEQQIKVSLQLDKIGILNIPLNQVFGAIQAANQNIPGGYLDIGTHRFNIQSNGSYESIKDIENTVIQAANGKIVQLKDVADISMASEDITYQARYDQKRAMFLTVQQKEGTNIFSVMKGINKSIDAFSVKANPTIHLERVFDQSESVSTRLNSFFINLLEGIILVGIVMFLAVNAHASAVVMMAIPFSVIIAIGLVDINGYGLHQMTIAGLIIALGMLVDNAIVVTDNITRFMRLGHKAKDAAVLATTQVGWAVTNSTVTTVLAFTPMLLMQNDTGQFIRSMPLIVIFSLMASLWMSLTLTPYLSSKFLKITDATKVGRVRKYLDHFIATKYRALLKWALDHPRRFMAIIIAVFLVSVSLFPFIGVSFFPKAEKPQFMINIRMPEGTSLAKTDSVARYVENVLMGYPDISHYAANIGHGNPRIYYNTFTENENSSYAQLFVHLKEFDYFKYEKIIGDLRTTFRNYPGAEIVVKEFEQGPPFEAPIAIRILGDNLQTMKQIAADVEKMIAQTEGTVNIHNPLESSRTNLFVHVNREKAGLLGVPMLDIERAIRTAVAGLAISSYRDAEGKQYDIVVRSAFKERFTLADLERIYVSSLSGAQIPLTQLASIEFKATPLIIKHYHMERNVTVTADVVGKTSVDKVTKQIAAQLEKYDWPKGYRYSIGGELESREESFGGMMKAILVAMVAIFAVLVLQFKSYSQPLIIFSTIPLAVIGSLWALFITGYSFSFTAFIGLTSLVGIVVNNAILLVDYTNQLRQQGKTIKAAIKEAGETRFVAILLTAMTTVFGLLPLTFGGGTIWGPMAWTIIGGLTVSTFLTLVVTPVLYILYTPKVTK